MGVESKIKELENQNTLEHNKENEEVKKIQKNIKKQLKEINQIKDDENIPIQEKVNKLYKKLVIEINNNKTLQSDRTILNRR